MVVLMSMTNVLALLTLAAGIVVSFLSADWTWFARSDCVVTVEAICIFAFFDERFTRYFLKATGIDMREAAGRQELEDRISRHRKNKLAGANIPDWCFEE